MMSETVPLTLVTGATGYIGGRLVPHLTQAGYKTRVMVRDENRIKGRSWLKDVEVVKGDVFDLETLGFALQGVHTAFYLIHSMSGAGNFHQRDLQAASNFGQVAKRANVKRIIYLGGLGHSASNLSEHLRSRQETGKKLAEAGVPVTEFRAAIIVGSGSISFEMIRNLTEKLPVMICPKWVFTRVQPIGISDVLSYLVGALTNEQSTGKIIEIGGKDVLTYGDMMLEYANVRGLKRFLIPVPVLTPRLSSHWVHWMTPFPASISRPLIEGLRNEVTVKTSTAQMIFPEIKPICYRTAVQRALDRLMASDVETRWNDNLYTSNGGTPLLTRTYQEGMIIENRQIIIEANPDRVFKVLSRLGGDCGWLYMNWAWKLRGFIDRVLGGVGFRRGRRHPQNLRVGDIIDFWRVEGVKQGILLRLRAEMKLPGKAWLQFKIEGVENHKTFLMQQALFAPKGLVGYLYWYALYPIHNLIFSGLARRLKEISEIMHTDQL